MIQFGSSLFNLARSSSATVESAEQRAGIDGTVEVTRNEEPSSFRFESRIARGAIQEPRRSRQLESPTIGGRESKRYWGRSVYDEVAASTQYEFDKLHRALADKERQLGDMQRKEQAGRDRANEMIMERDGLLTKLEEMKSDNARLRRLKHDSEDSKGRALAKIAELEEKVHRQQQDAKNSRAEVAAVNTRMESTLKLLETRTHELKGAQVFVTKADVYSGAEVIALVKSLNEEIFQLSAFMADSLPMSDSGGAPVSGDQRVIAENRMEEYLGVRLKVALVSQAHDEDPTVLQMALQFYLAGVSSGIIGAWSLGESAANIISLYGEVRDGEIQAVAGRWRALARRHLRQTTRESDCEDMLRGHVCSYLVDILQIAKCQLSCPEILEELNKYGDRIDKVIAGAMQLRRILGEDVTSCDLDIVCHEGGVIFDPTRMEDAGGDGSSYGTTEVVLCTVGLGLTRREAKVDKEGRVIDVTLLLKPTVMLDAQILGACV